MSEIPGATLPTEPNKPTEQPSQGQEDQQPRQIPGQEFLTLPPKPQQEEKTYLEATSAEGVFDTPQTSQPGQVDRKWKYYGGERATEMYKASQRLITSMINATDPEIARLIEIGDYKGILENAGVDTETSPDFQSMSEKYGIKPPELKQMVENMFDKFSQIGKARNLEQSLEGLNPTRRVAELITEYMKEKGLLNNEQADQITAVLPPEQKSVIEDMFSKKSEWRPTEISFTDKSPEMVAQLQNVLEGMADNFLENVAPDDMPKHLVQLLWSHTIPMTPDVQKWLMDRMAEKHGFSVQGKDLLEGALKARADYLQRFARSVRTVMTREMTWDPSQSLRESGFMDPLRAAEIHKQRAQELSEMPDENLVSILSRDEIARSVLADLSSLGEMGANSPLTQKVRNAIDSLQTTDPDRAQKLREQLNKMFGQ